MEPTGPPPGLGLLMLDSLLTGVLSLSWFPEESDNLKTF